MGQDGCWIEEAPEPNPQRLAAFLAMDLDGEYNETLDVTLNATSYQNVIDIELEREGSGVKKRYKLRVEEAA